MPISIQAKRTRIVEAQLGPEHAAYAGAGGASTKEIETTKPVFINNFPSVFFQAGKEPLPGPRFKVLVPTGSYSLTTNKADARDLITTGQGATAVHQATRWVHREVPMTIKTDKAYSIITSHQYAKIYGVDLSQYKDDGGTVKQRSNNTILVMEHTGDVVISTLPSPDHKTSAVFSGGVAVGPINRSGIINLTHEGCGGSIVDGDGRALGGKELTAILKNDNFVAKDTPGVSKEDKLSGVSGVLKKSTATLGSIRTTGSAEDAVEKLKKIGRQMAWIHQQTSDIEGFNTVESQRNAIFIQAHIELTQERVMQGKNIDRDLTQIKTNLLRLAKINMEEKRKSTLEAHVEPRDSTIRSIRVDDQSDTLDGLDVSVDPDSYQPAYINVHRPVDETPTVPPIYGNLQNPDGEESGPPVPERDQSLRPRPAPRIPRGTGTIRMDTNLGPSSISTAVPDDAPVYATVKPKHERPGYIPPPPTTSPEDSDTDYEDMGGESSDEN